MAITGFQVRSGKWNDDIGVNGLSINCKHEVENYFYRFTVDYGESGSWGDLFGQQEEKLPLWISNKIR